MTQIREEGLPLHTKNIDVYVSEYDAETADYHPSKNAFDHDNLNNELQQYGKLEQELKLAEEQNKLNDQMTKE